MTQSQPQSRAFVTASGYLFQIVGFSFAFGGCCLWSLSGQFQSELDEPVLTFGDYFAGHGTQGLIGMVSVVSTFCGGLGLLATGMGLQGERPNSGRWAVAVTASLGIVWLGAAVAYGVQGAAWWKLLVAMCFTLLCAILFMLAGNSARILRLHPPPQDNVITDQELEKLRRH